MPTQNQSIDRNEQVRTAVKAAYFHRKLEDYRDPQKTPIWTEQMAAALPPWAEVGDSKNPIAYYRYFTASGAEWYIFGARAGKEDTLFLAYCFLPGGFPEVGYVTRSELADLPVATGNPFHTVELDRGYAPQTYEQIKLQLERNRCGWEYGVQYTGCHGEPLGCDCHWHEQLDAMT